MRKRIICVLLIVFMCMSLCGCESAAVKQAKEAVAAIGTVSIDSGSAILNAEALFGQLSVEEKASFSSAQQLQDSRAQYEELVSKAIISSLDQGDYDGALELVKSLDKDTVSAISESVATRLLQVLAWFGASKFEQMDFKDGATKSKTAGKIVGLLSIPSSCEYADIGKILSSISEFLIMYQDCGDFCAINEGVDQEAITSALQKVNDGFENSSKFYLELGAMELLAIIDTISYNGSENKAIEYIDSLSAEYAGLVVLLGGIESKNNTAIKEGALAMQDAGETQMALAELYAEILKARIEIMAMFGAWDCINGINARL